MIKLLVSSLARWTALVLSIVPLPGRIYFSILVGTSTGWDMTNAPFQMVYLSAWGVAVLFALVGCFRCGLSARKEFGHNAFDQMKWMISDLRSRLPGN